MSFVHHSRGNQNNFIMYNLSHVSMEVKYDSPETSNAEVQSVIDRIPPEVLMERKILASG